MASNVSFIIPRQIMLVIEANDGVACSMHSVACMVWFIIYLTSLGPTTELTSSNTSRLSSAILTSFKAAVISAKFDVCHSAGCCMSSVSITLGAVRRTSCDRHVQAGWQISARGATSEGENCSNCSVSNPPHDDHRMTTKQLLDWPYHRHPDCASR